MTDVSLKWQTVLTDLATLATGGITLLVFFVGVTPIRRGFYCTDESIRYPFHDSTIPNWMLYIYTFTIPFVVISLTEFLSHRRSRSTGTFLSRPVPIWFLHMYRSFVDFLFGCVASQLMTDVGKYTMGRLRPNFIAVCNPNITLTHCDMYGNKYITDYKCQDSQNDAKESRVSFPSGHSSFSAYTMFYVAIYVQLRWNVMNKRSHLRLIKCGIQICLILIAYYTALSRVMDNKHHWSDVSAGALIGVVTASLTARYVSSLMNDKALSDDKLPYSINSGPLTGGARRPQSNYDLEAQQIPKDQPLGDQH
ncbi:putative phosphatidate phosphatase isoform X1 [Folsomia candida]|uniref:putative phosphatidate phosphatase isoform X1 n=1 Tax=Folsomia candida TaxID=158441 RepID=UPI000B8EFFCD|nr:putative phosphatidate phosphatase isoform X1 [Folsomia candida]XP_021950495.1 putative phosphatidate phosphatase isoform X1 [Folsomia candida]